MRLSGWCLVLCGALACAGAEACDYCLLSQGISPLDTIDGRGLRLVQRYTELDRVYAGSRELDNPGARETYHTTELSGFWSARPWLTVMAVLPFRVTAVDGHLEHHGGHHHADADDHEDHDHHDEESVVDPAVRAVEDQHGGDGGLGDVSLLARARVFQRHTLDSTTTLALLAGVRLPTGNTDGRADDGAYLDAHLQLGSGATDGLFGAAFQHVRGRWALNGNVLGALRGQGEAGAHDYDYGDSLNYDLTVRYRVSPATLGGGPRRWFLSCGLGGEVRGKEIEAGSRIDDSGGHVLFVQPGLQLGVGARWTFEVGAQVPVHHDLAGTQLGEDLKVFGALNVLL
ncbi:MAG: transporter [Gammaproteobacteria bacterium]|nr:transporter [Gammaproteobacteria bacterium]